MRILLGFMCLFVLRVSAQSDTLPPFPHRIWFFMGPIMAAGSPTVCFSDRRSVEGAQIGVAYEKHKQVLIWRVYSITDLYGYDFWGSNLRVPYKLKYVKDISVSYGHRFRYKWGSVIPSIGFSYGRVAYRLNVRDTVYAPGLLGWGSTPKYQYYDEIYNYVGVPISIRVLTSYKFNGIELGAYCNLHKHTDLGFYASLLLGKISDYHWKKKGSKVKNASVLPREG